MSFRAIAFPNSDVTSASSPSSSHSATHPPSAAAFLLVLLHGWGANAEDVATMAPYLLPSRCPDRLSMLFPDAPFRHPMPGGYMWYNLSEHYTFGPSYPETAPDDLVHSRTLLIEWLQGLEAQTHIPLSRTILAGFSQGGAMTADVGLRLPLAGLMILSGYLHDELQPFSPTCPPILQVHGRHDPVVPLMAAQQLRDRLTRLDTQVTYHELNMGHDIPLTVLELMQSFIQDILESREKGSTEVL